jgi:hypothetical protein
VDFSFKDHEDLEEVAAISSNSVTSSIFLLNSQLSLQQSVLWWLFVSTLSHQTMQA